MQILGRMRTKIRLNIKEDIRYFLVCIEGGGGRGMEEGRKRKKEKRKKEKQAVLKLEALGFGEKSLWENKEESSELLKANLAHLPLSGLLIFRVTTAPINCIFTIQMNYFSDNPIISFNPLPSPLKHKYYYYR